MAGDTQHELLSCAGQWQGIAMLNHSLRRKTAGGKQFDALLSYNVI